MPWTAASFSQKHNKKLHGAAAAKAARMATGMVKAGMDEGKAIRIANAAGDKAMSKSERRYGGSKSGR